MRSTALLLTLLFSNNMFADSAQVFYTASEPRGEEREHARMISPEEEAFLDTFWQAFAVKRFPQTTWGECSEAISGNYAGYACSDKRVISVILKKFIGENIYTCINRGLSAQGGGRVQELHIIHNGITGDAAHSPRSLHAENRAIDIKTLDMKLADGRLKKLVYEGTTNRAFYTAFRKCWGQVINTQNGCPLYKSSSQLTGSIGWEDANHRHHLHLSVPHCVSGKYSTSYYQK